MTPVKIAVVVLAGLCGGCSSPKTHFYMLNVAPAKTGHHRGLSRPIQLTAVHIPPSLDRQQMVRMSGQNSVTIFEFDQWAGSFGEIVRNTLALDLRALLPTGQVILPEAPTPAQRFSLVVTIAQFAANPSGTVKLSGSWSILDGQSDSPVLQRDFQFLVGGAVTPDFTAAAMSNALGRLAAQIAGDLDESAL